MNRNACRPLVAICAVTFPVCWATASDVDSLVVYADFGRAVTTAEGRDGRRIVYPSEWKITEGRDGLGCISEAPVGGTQVQLVSVVPGFKLASWNRAASLAFFAA
jgi:hypothetical protein